MNLNRFLILVFTLVSFSGFSQTKSGLRILKHHPVSGSGGWDYVTVDSQAKKLYVSHGKQVNILNTENGDSVGVILNTNGVHGIALANSFDKGYTSNGLDSTCTVFDLKSNSKLATIKVGVNPDAIFYEEFSKKVYVFNGRSKDASVIDPSTDRVVATIALGGKPEAAVSDGKGKLFVNSETTNEVVVIDVRTNKVVNRYQIVGGEEPSGLAIDRVTNRLFIGCGGNAQLIVMDAINGKNLASFKIGDCDGVAFDPARKMIYASNNDGFLSVIKEVKLQSFNRWKMCLRRRVHGQSHWIQLHIICSCRLQKQLRLALKRE
jgi:YVTN family beta-propeller protein